MKPLAPAKRILVTGGAGFIGYALAKQLAEESPQNDVWVCDNLLRGRMDDIFKALINQKNVTYVQGDLTEKEAFNALEGEFDEIYHLAALNGTENFYNKPDLVLKVNILSLYQLLEWRKTKRKGKILFTSSSETYAGTISEFEGEVPTPETIPLCISDVFNPRWSYGGSKIIGEIMAINYARVYEFPISVIRYHNIYGPRMGYEHVMPQFCLRVIEGKNTFEIFGGKETRAFCYIDDGVKATIEVMRSEEANGEIVNIGNSKEEIEIKAMAKLLFNIADIHPKLVVKPAPEGCVQRRCPNVQKLKEKTGFEAKVSLEEGLKKTWEWYKDHPKP